MTPTIDLKLAKLREGVVSRVRALRQERGWTQAALAEKLGLSQARLSEIERGGGSFTAEQLLVVLSLFNVPIDRFLPATEPEDALQNTLIQLGATHLRVVPDAVTPGGAPDPADAIVDTMLASRASRLVTALAPVVVHHLDHVALPALRLRFAAAGRAPRLGWLLDNLREALTTPPPYAPVAWRRRAARATTVLSDELDHFPPPSDDVTPDLFDPTIRSSRTRELVWTRRASSISRRWRIVSELQPSDFRDALWSADEPG